MLAYVVGYGILIGLIVFLAVKQKNRSQPNRPNNTARPSARRTPPPSTRANLIREDATPEMIYFADDPLGREQTDRSGCTYRFVYKKVDGCYRAYITQMPDLNGRDGSCVVTHRYRDGNRFYVCWDTPIYKLSEIQSVSMVWANNIQRYIVTGKHFG